MVMVAVVVVVMMVMAVVVGGSGSGAGDFTWCFFYQVQSLKALKKYLDEQTVTKTVEHNGNRAVREGFENN